MIHLFNKIYVKPPAEFTDSHSVMIMFPTEDSIPQDPFMREVNARSFGTVLMSSASLADAFVHFGGEDLFFQTLLAFDPTKRLTLYVQGSDMLELLCKWYKTLLPNVTATTAHTIVSLVYKRMEYIFGYTHNSIVFLSDYAASVYRAAGQLLPSFEEFEQVWDQAVPFTVTPAQRDALRMGASLEYQIATTLSGETLPDQAAFEAKIVRLVRKVQIAALVDVKLGALAKLNALPDYVFETQPLAGWVADHPEYQILVDPLFTPDRLEYVEATYSYEDLRAIYLTLLGLIEYGYDPIVDQQAHVLDPDLTYTKIIESELASLHGRVMLGISVNATIINGYLLDTILNLYRDGDTATLAELSLV